MKLNKNEKLNEIKILLQKKLITEEEFEYLKQEVYCKKQGKRNKELKIVEDIISNTNKSSFNLKPQKKSNKKSNNNYSSNLKFFLALAIILVIFIKLYVPSEQRDILSIYPDAKKFQDIRKTNWILVTNSNNKSNVYDTKTKKFLLNNWYEAKYDEGIVYDDITFDVNGNSKMCSEHSYHYLAEKGDAYLDGRFISEEEQINNYENSIDPKELKEWRVCNNCPGSSCSRCFGRGYYWGKEH